MDNYSSLLFEKHNFHNRKSNLEDIMNNSSSYNEEEIEFIPKHYEEFNKYYCTVLAKTSNLDDI